MRVDIVVVGAGLVGAAAARHATDAGYVVTCIGPQEPADARSHAGPFGSHHDSGRITRHIDTDPVWSELARRSIVRYPDIARRSGIDFHRPVGLMWIGQDERALTEIRRVAERMEVPLDSGARHPVDTSGLAHAFEPSPAGYIDPRRLRDAQRTIAESGGCRFVDAVVTGIDGGRVTVGDLTVEAEHVIVATGAYDPPGVPSQEVVATAETVWMVPVSEPERFQDMPSIVVLVDDGRIVDLYAVPPTMYPDGNHYFKFGIEGATPVPLEPGAIDHWMRSTPERSERAEEWVRRLLPDLSLDVVISKPCLYARTPDHHPILKRVDEYTVVVRGGNGRAAKSSDELGRLGTDLATNNTRALVP